MMIPSTDLKRFVEDLARRDSHRAVTLDSVRRAILGWAKCYAIVHRFHDTIPEKRLAKALDYYLEIRASRYRQPELLSA